MASGLQPLPASGSIFVSGARQSEGMRMRRVWCALGGVFVAVLLSNPLNAQSGATSVSSKESYDDQDSSTAITSVLLSADQTILFVLGRHFDRRSSVVLGDFALGGVQISPAGDQLTALMPALAPGTYHLVISKGASSGRAVGADVTVGAVGPRGPQGEIGPRGDVGPLGPQGLQGEIGPRGPQGDIGPLGPQGEIGPRGPQGEIGVRGAQGEIGPQGIEGPRGPAGPQGPGGLTGATGATGATGPQGPEGPAGVVTTVLLNGPIGAALQPSFAFVGPTAIVTLTEKQRLTATASAVLGHKTAGAPSMDYTICTQRVGSSTLVTLSVFVSVRMSGEAGVTQSYTGHSTQPASVFGGAGTYLVGFCARTGVNSSPVDLFDWVQGWAIVTN
jgi:hypothetical protein